MPPDSPSEQELMLKKRARRRLVGAVALVLLMIILLPQVLQDRAVLAQQDKVIITMPEPANTQQNQAEHSVAEASIGVVDDEPKNAVATKVLADPAPNVNEAVASDNISAQNPKDIENKSVASPVQATVASKSKELFTIQVGVYSDAANVKRLQDQLKQAGFSSKTEKINTAKGESIRLKTGAYNSRQDAMTALEKIKEIGMSGIVVSQE
jgi:DedD protein